MSRYRYCLERQPTHSSGRCRETRGCRGFPDNECGWAGCRFRLLKGAAGEYGARAAATARLPLLPRCDSEEPSCHAALRGGTRYPPGRSSLLQARDDGRCHLCQPGVHARRPPLVPSLPGRGPKIRIARRCPVHASADRSPTEHVRAPTSSVRRPSADGNACDMQRLSHPDAHPGPPESARPADPDLQVVRPLSRYGHNRAPAKHSRPALPQAASTPASAEQGKDAVATARTGSIRGETEENRRRVEARRAGRG